MCSAVWCPSLRQRSTEAAGHPRKSARQRAGPAGTSKHSPSAHVGSSALDAGQRVELGFIQAVWSRPMKATGLVSPTQASPELCWHSIKITHVAWHAGQVQHGMHHS